MMLSEKERERMQPKNIPAMDVRIDNDRLTAQLSNLDAFLSHDHPSVRAAGKLLQLTFKAIEEWAGTVAEEGIAETDMVNAVVNCALPIMGAITSISCQMTDPDDLLRYILGSMEGKLDQSLHETVTERIGRRQ